MEAAGINPTLAAGSPAQAQPLKGALTEGAEKAALAMSMLQMKKNISKTDAEIANINADTSSKQVGVDYFKDTYESRVAEAKANSWLRQNEQAAEQELHQIVMADGRIEMRNMSFIRREAEAFDSMIKSMDREQAVMALSLARELFNKVASGVIDNPAISEAWSKYYAAKIMKKEYAWFERKAWMGLGSTGVNTGLDVFKGINSAKTFSK